MRSSWEILYAKYLDKNKIKWEYESKQFDLGKLTYRPDFYLPKTDTYIEIKGYWRAGARKRVKLFYKLYPLIKLEIKTQIELEKLGIKCR